MCFDIAEESLLYEELKMLKVLVLLIFVAGMSLSSTTSAWNNVENLTREKLKSLEIQKAKIDYISTQKASLDKKTPMIYKYFAFSFFLFGAIVIGGFSRRYIQLGNKLEEKVTSSLNTFPHFYYFTYDHEGLITDFSSNLKSLSFKIGIPWQDVFHKNFFQQKTIDNSLYLSDVDLERVFIKYSNYTKKNNKNIVYMFAIEKSKVSLIVNTNKKEKKENTVQLDDLIENAIAIQSSFKESSILLNSVKINSKASIVSFQDKKLLEDLFKDISMFLDEICEREQKKILFEIDMIKKIHVINLITDNFDLENNKNSLCYLKLIRNLRVSLTKLNGSLSIKNLNVGDSKYEVVQISFAQKPLNKQTVRETMT